MKSAVKADAAQRQASLGQENLKPENGQQNSNNYLTVIQNDQKVTNTKTLRMMNSLSPTPNVSVNPP